jgi:Ras-related GTP-binding protein A/B
MAKKKVLLMGKAHSGKTSMRSIIFANYLARDTTRLSPTLDVEHHHVRFLGDLVLNLWDCGGQDAFFESYFERDRETIFRSVELLIYVFDIESETPEKDFDHFSGVLQAIEENSPDARVFVLIHKMDLVAEEDRAVILEDRKRLIGDSCASELQSGTRPCTRHGPRLLQISFPTSPYWKRTSITLLGFAMRTKWYYLSAQRFSLLLTLK